MAVNKIKEIQISTNEANRRDTLNKLAATAMTSKLIKRNTEFFTKSISSHSPASSSLANRSQWSSMLSCPSTKKTSTKS